MCVEVSERSSRLPCARGAVTPKGFRGATEGLYPRQSRAFAPSVAPNLRTARERPRLPLRRGLACRIKDLCGKTEGEIHRVSAKTEKYRWEQGRMVTYVLALCLTIHLCKRYHWSRIQPLSHVVLILNRRASSLCTGELRTALRQRGARLHRSAQRRLALSLPQSFCAASGAKIQLPPQREPRRLPPHATDFHLAGAENRAPFTHGRAEENPLSHLSPRSGGKCQLPLQARGAKWVAPPFHSAGGAA